MLSEEVKKYRELSGDDNPNTPISRIGGYLDGYERAMEQLPSVPNTNVGEYINREDALMCLTGEWTELTDEVIHRFIKRIKNLPLMVLPKQRMGHWTHDGSHWENRFICSECGYKLFDEQTNYCPNCGAKMASPTGAESEV